MPKFRYRAVDDYGKYRRGTLEANSFQLAADQLKGQGLWIVDLFDQSKSLLYKELNFGGPKVKTEHFTVFCRQLSTLYKSGVNMVEAVRVLGEQTPSKVFRKILLDVADEMLRGTQFSVAIKKYPSVFTTVFVSMVHAGEVSGNLDEMLQRLAQFFEKEHYTKEKVKSAMIYPIIMGIITIAVVTIMMKFVIPKYVANFRAMGIELPLPTRIIIHISDFVQHRFLLLLLILAVPVILIRLLNRIPKTKYYVDYYKLRIPVFGKLWHKQSIARFSRTFSSLFAAAIPLLQLMTVVSSVVGNEAIRKLILESREGLKGGQSIAEPFRHSPLFPPMVVHMMSVGEKSGTIDTMLEKVADFYEADVDQMAERLKSLLEPVMILILAVIVGSVVTAVMLPTFKLLQNYHG